MGQYRLVADPHAINSKQVETWINRFNSSPGAQVFLNRPGPSTSGVTSFLLRRAARAAMLVLLLAVDTTFGPSAAAEVRKLPARVAAAFDFDGNIRFCYDRAPEIIYFRYDTPNDRTLVEARSIDGVARTVFEFPGVGDQRSLSCSVDGSTIAALSVPQDHLYIFKASQLSAYKIVHWRPYSVGGEFSLLSPDGSVISALDEPTLISGPDALAQMQFLKVQISQRVFFDGGYAYIDEDRTIDIYRYTDGWNRLRSITKPAGFDVRDIVRCGSHLVASLADDDNARFLAFDEQGTVSADWLSRIGFKALLRAFDDLVEIHGGYGRCAFPLSPKRDVRHLLSGIATFDDRGMLRFAIEGPPLALSQYAIRLSKDGCYALLAAFKQVPKIPEFTMPHQAVVLKLAAPGCAF